MVDENDIDSLFSDSNFESEVEVNEEAGGDQAVKETPKEEPKKTEEAPKADPDLETKLNAKLEGAIDTLRSEIKGLYRNTGDSPKETAKADTTFADKVAKAQARMDEYVAKGLLTKDHKQMMKDYMDDIIVEQTGGRYNSVGDLVGTLETGVTKLSDGLQGVSSNVVKRELSLAVSELKTDNRLNKTNALFPTYAEWHEEVFMPEYLKSERAQEKVASALKYQDPKAYFEKQYKEWVGENAMDDSFLKGHAKLNQRMEDRKRGATIHQGDQTVSIKRTGTDEKKPKKNTTEVVRDVLSGMIGAKLYN